MANISTYTANKGVADRNLEERLILLQQMLSEVKERAVIADETIDGLTDAIIELAGIVGGAD